MKNKIMDRNAFLQFITFYIIFFLFNFLKQQKIHRYDIK
jgi:hypothetical protein